MRQKSGGKLAGRLGLYNEGATKLATEIILQSLDIVFAEIRAALDLNEDQPFDPHVFDPVSSTDWNVHGLAGCDPDFPPIERDLSGAGHDHPMLGPPLVRLITK